MRRMSYLEKFGRVYVIVGLILWGGSDVLAGTVEVIGQERYVFADYSSSGQLANDHTSYDQNRAFGTAISADGRYVAFISNSRVLAGEAPGTYPRYRPYLRDIVAGTTTSIPLPEGALYGVGGIKMSEDAKYLLFHARQELYLHTVATGENKRIGAANFYDISGDGHYVYYNDVNDRNVYRYDTQTGNIVSISGYRNQIMGASREGDLASTDGFSCYLYNINNGTTRDLTRLYIDSSHSMTFNSDISPDGKAVVFFSNSTNLLPVPYPVPPNYRYSNMFLYDIDKSTMQYIALTDLNNLPFFIISQQLYWFGDSLAISNGGRYVALNGASAPAILYDRTRNETLHLRLNNNLGALAGASITPDGRYLSGWWIGAGYMHVVRIDLQPNSLTVSAGPDQTVEQDSTNGAYATLHGSLSQGECNSSQTFEWSWAGGATTGTDPTVFLPPGVTTVTLNWSGCGATASDVVDVTVQDTISPSLSADVLGVIGNNGWYRSDLQVQLTAEDSGSGVAEIRCSLDGGAEQADPGAGLTVSVAGDGTHTLSCFAVDLFGNTSEVQTKNLAIDTVPPTVNSELVGTLYRDGLYVSDVVLDLKAADQTSGVDALNLTVNGEAQGAAGDGLSLLIDQNGSYLIAYFAHDQAGNLTEGVLPPFALDKTLLANALYETLTQAVATLPAVDFGRTNPNDVAKLLSELAKVNEELSAIPGLADPVQQLTEYRWVRQKLTDKLLPECRRMISDADSLAGIEAEIGRILTAIDERIVALGG